MMMHCERSTRRLSPKSQRGLVQNAEQQLPERIGGLFDFIEEQDRQLELFRVPLVECFLRQQGMSFPGPGIPAANQSTLRSRENAGIRRNQS